MSTSIDERIVKMSFNNANFENAVKTTLSSLADLKKSLNMDSAKAGLGAIASAANGIKLDGLTTQVSGLSSQFEGLKAVALGALVAIGAKVADLAVQMSKDFVSGMTESARAGFDEYELKLGSIQTILANTEKYGTKLEDVTGALDELNDYADKTIYNFGDMTKNIGLFTNAGIGVEDATSMIKGFSNAAAASGTSSQGAASAAYQLSQALSSGTIRLMDWRSLTNVGMGNKNMQQGLIDIAGAMGRFAETGDNANAVAADFNASLESNWLSADVMSSYLQIMAGDMDDAAMAALGLSQAQIDAFKQSQKTAEEAATKVRSLSQLMDTLAEAAGSGWTETWETVFGDFNEATELFTYLSEVIGGYQSASAAARNEQVKMWSDLGGRTAIVDAIKNVFMALDRILKPITAAFKKVFPPSWGTTLAHISFAIRDFTAGLIISEKASATLGRVAEAVFTGLKFVVDLVTGSFKVFFTIIGQAFGLLGGLIGLVTPFISFLFSLIPPMEKAGDSTKSFADILSELISGGIQPVIKWLTAMGDALNDLLNGDTSKIKDGFMDALNPLLVLGGQVKNVWKGVVSWFETYIVPIGGRMAAAWTGAGSAIAGAWGYLKGLAGDAGPIFADIGSKIMDFLSNIDMEQVLAAVNTGVLLAVGLGIKKAFSQISGVFDGVSGMFDGIKDAIGGITGVLEGMQTKLKADALLKISIAIAVLAGSLVILSMVDPNRLVPAAAGLATAAGILLGGLAILDKINAEPSVKASVAITMIATAMNILATALVKIGGLDWNELARGVSGLAVTMGLMVAAAKVIGTMEKDIVRSAAAMNLMSTAVLLMAGAVAIFGNLPMDVLIQGGIAVAVALGVITGAAMLINKFAPNMALSAVGLMAMAAALNMLVVPILALGLLPMETLTQGMTAVGIALGGLAIVAVLMSKVGPQMAIAAVGLMAMAVALNLLVVPIIALGSIGLDTLIQGLIGVAGAVAILVVAANLMTGAIVGAGAMIVMAGAVVILAVAIQMIGSMPIEQVLQGIIGIAGGMLIVGAAAALLGAVAPLLLAGAAGLLLVGAAMLAMAGAVVIFAVGLALLGPALLIASGGLLAFAQVAPKIAEAVPAFLGIGAGLLVFGAGAAVAGAGILVLGAGLVVLGAGLALVGAVGIIGSTALTAFVLSLGKLAGEMPNMLAMAGTFTVLGAAVLVLGSGMLVLGAGGLLTGAALLLLVPLGAMITASFMLITAAINKLIPQTEKIAKLSTNFDKLGASIKKVASSGTGASSGLASTATSFDRLGTSAQKTTTLLQTMGTVVLTAMAMVAASTRNAETAASSSLRGMTNSFNTFKMGLDSASRGIEQSTRSIARAVGSSLVSELNSSRGSVENAGYYVGRAASDGMANGIRSGQYRVVSAAQTVALAALAASRRTLDVRSPSRKMFAIGAYTTEGQADGMISKMGLVENAASDVGNTAINTLKKTLNGMDTLMDMNVDMEPVIRPVMDLSGLRKDSATIGGMFAAPKIKVDGTYANALSTQAEVSSTQDARDEQSGGGNTYNYFEQHNTSPKALSNAEIYRRTKNQISAAKGALTTTNAKPS